MYPITIIAEQSCSTDHSPVYVKLFFLIFLCYYIVRITHQILLFFIDAERVHMHLPALQKLLALFISGSLLLSSVPVYAGEIVSIARSVSSEGIEEPVDTAGHSDAYDDDSESDEDTAGKGKTDTVDEIRDTPAAAGSAADDGSNTPDSGSATDNGSNASGFGSAADDGLNPLDSEADGSEADKSDGAVESDFDTASGGLDNSNDNDTGSDNNKNSGDSGTNSNGTTNPGDSGTSGEEDTDSGDSDTSDEGTGADSFVFIKKENFAYLYHNDVNDPAYNALRKELDEIFKKVQPQDITDLPENYSLVSLPFGGEGPGGSKDRSAPIMADQGRDVLMPVYNQGETMNICWSYTGTGIIESYLIRNHYDKLREQGIELSKWQAPNAGSRFINKDTVIGGYSVDPSQYGETIGSDLNGGATPQAYGQAVTGWAGLDYEKNIPTPRHNTLLAELTPAQVDQAVVRGRDALYLLSPTPCMRGHEGYDKNIDPAEATVYDPGAVAAIKNCLMTIAPVYIEIAYYPNEPAEKGGINAYENWEYGSMYYPVFSDYYAPSHAVTIVGWDDHYSRTLFGENTPPGDGAFLIKNSFGKTEKGSEEDLKAGDQSLFREGYFWLSYYDATIQTPATFTGTLVEESKYDHLYMNDHTGFANTPFVVTRAGAFDSDRNDDGVIQKDELVRCANVFKAKDNEMLKSVGILADRANSLAEYWIYLLKEDYANPEDGELIYSAAGENGIKAKYAGYNVQDLAAPIALVKDQLFSVVVRVFGSEGGQLPLEVGSDWSEAPNTKIARGQTYYTDENGNWTDVCDIRTTPELYIFRTPEDMVLSVGNATIRAMTSDADLSYKVTKGDGSEWKSGTGTGLKISANGEHGKFSYLMIDGKRIDASEYTVSGSRTDAALPAGLLKRLGEGEHSIMFVYDDGWASGTFSVVADHSDTKDKRNAGSSGSSLSKKVSTSKHISSSKNSSPETGDAVADSIPAWSLLITLSLVSIIVVKRKALKAQ